MSPAEIAAETLSVAAATVTSVEPIKHGLTNESWLVRTASDAVVVRISNTAEVELQIDRASEAAILDGVAQVGIGAEVLRNDLVQRVLVTRYLGAAWTHEAAMREQNIERIAVVLRRLHAVKPPRGARHVDLAASVGRYLDVLTARGTHDALTSESARRPVLDALMGLGDSPARLCHNDVHYLNIVDDGALHLIDWEYAGIGEPFFDLASVCVQHSYDDARSRLLLWTYLDGEDWDEWDRLVSAKQVFGYIQDLWLAVR